MNDNLKFKIWYSAFSDAQRLKYRDEIIARCGLVNTNIFYNWYQGRTAIPFLAKEIIKDIAGYNIFE